MNKTNTAPVRTGRLHSTRSLLAIAALLLLMAGAASAEVTTYGDGWRQVCYDDGRCSKTYGVTTYQTYNGSYVPTPISQINPAPLGYDILWNGGRLHTRWDGVYAFDMIVNPDTDQTVSYWDFWHVESYRTTGQGSWQEEIPVSNTFVKIDNSTLKREMTLDSGGKFNITYHVQGNKLKADLELTAGYARKYRFVHRTDTIPSNFSLNNQSKKFDAGFFNGLLIYDWSDVPPYTADENGTYLGGYNTTQWVDNNARKFYQQIEGVKRLNVSEKWSVDPSWQIGGSGGNAWSGNSSTDNVTENWDDNGDITLSGVYNDEFDNGSTINSKWSWIREPVGKYFQGGKYLQINTTNTDLYQSTNTAPILVQSGGNENLTIITKVSATPDTNYEQGSIIFYADDDNYVKLSYAYSAGIIANMLKEDNAVAAQAYPSVTSDPIFLKLIKTGTSYTGYYSTNRVTWTSVATYTLNDTITKVGVSAFDNSANSAEPIQFLFFVTDNFTSTGNLTTWHDAGANNETYQVDVNVTTPDNTNYTVWYANNGTGSYSQLGGTLTGNNSLTISGTKYQNTDMQVRLAGNTTATPELMVVTFFTQAASGGSSGAIPPDPTTLANTTGNFWINYTWAAGAGNVTNSFNVSQNGTWTNGSANTLKNASVGAHNWSNITVFAFNSSGNGNLSTGSVSMNTQVPNNALSQSAIGNKNVREGTWLNFTVGVTDADNDAITCGTNASKGTLAGCNFNWSTIEGDSGTYIWYFNSSDGYGSTGNETITVIVADSTPGTISNLANTTGNFWINWTWNAGANADDYDIQINGTDIGYDNDTRYYNGTYSAHATRIISVRTHNHTLDSYSAWTNQTTTIPNNVPVQAAIGDKSVDENQWLNFTISTTDADSDSITYQTNATKGTLTTNSFAWKPTYTDSGTYLWEFNSSDGYGGTDTETITVTVNDIPCGGTGYDYCFSDNFSDNSLNTTFWSNTTSGSGTTNETEGAYYINLTANADAGILYTNNVYKDYNISGWVQFKGVTSGDVGVYLFGKNNTPAIQSNSVASAKIKAGVSANAPTLKFRLFYQNRTGSFLYWNETSQSWVTDPYAGVTAAAAVWRNFTILRNGTHYKFIFGNTTHKLMETTWLSSYSVLDGGYDDYFILGDPVNDANNQDMTIDNISVEWNTTTWKNYSYEDNPFIFEKDEGKHPNSMEWWYSYYHLNTTNNQYGIMTVYQMMPQKQFRIYNKTSNTVPLAFSTGSGDYFTQDTTAWNITYGWGTDVDIWRRTSDFSYFQQIQNGTTNLSINVTSLRPPLINNGTRPGHINMGAGGESAYYSQTNLSIVNGTLCISGVCEIITGGVAWYDRQWGNWSTSGYDGWDWNTVYDTSHGRELLFYNLYDASGNDSQTTPYYAIMYGNNSNNSGGNYSTSISGFTFEVSDFFYTSSGNIRSHRYNISIPSENLSLQMVAPSLTAYDFEQPFLVSGTWGSDTVSGYAQSETNHNWNAIRRNNFTISSASSIATIVPLNYTNDNNTYILNGTNMSWKNQIFADKNNNTLHGLLSGISRISKLNLSVVPNSSYVNVTVNAYNSTTINITIANSTAGQTMNLTVYNDTFQITNGANYQILKDGTIQQTAVASGNAATFTSINVGSDYTIQEGGGGYTPPTPVSCSASTGNFWINTSCSAGTGNITNGMNFTNGTIWVNGTSFFANRTLLPHAWSNESIYSFNSSGTGTLNQTPATLNTQILNNAPVMDAIGDKNADENTWLNFTVSGTDADSDALTCSTNASKGTLTGCDFNWSVTYDDAGTYLWTYYLNDSYSGSDSETITVTVSNIVNGTANITAWGNSNTSNSSLAFTVAKNTNITFNITANQSVTTTWTGTASPTKINGTGATDSYAFKNFTSTGTFTVIASCSNDNGSCTNGKTWTVTVTGTTITYTLTGLIDDEYGAYVIGAKVELEGLGNVNTNATGYYTITNISDGTYNLKTRAVAYKNTFQEISMSGNITKNITLKENDDAETGIAVAVLAIGVVFVVVRKRF